MPLDVLPEKLWKDIEPLIPKDPLPSRRGGRPRLPAQQALKGILFVLKSGIPWEMLPPELGCGSGMTCWRRLRDWQQAGVWKNIHEVLLARLRKEGKLNLKHGAVDGSNVRALFGGSKRVRIPQIKAARAPNVTFSQMEMAIHSWLSSREPIAMIPRRR